MIEDAPPIVTGDGYVIHQGDHVWYSPWPSIDIPLYCDVVRDDGNGGVEIQLSNEEWGPDKAWTELEVLRGMCIEEITLRCDNDGYVWHGRDCVRIRPRDP